MRLRSAILKKGGKGNNTKTTHLNQTENNPFWPNGVQNVSIHHDQTGDTGCRGSRKKVVNRSVKVPDLLQNGRDKTNAPTIIGQRKAPDNDPRRVV